MQPEGGEPVDLSYLCCPFLDPAAYERALAWLLPASPRTLAPRRLAARRSRSEPLTRLDRLLLPRGPYTADDVLYAKACAYWWQNERFSYDEVRAWLDGGLKPGEAGLAALLHEEGVPPDRLLEACQHRTTKEPATILSVARTFVPSIAHRRGETMSDLLDEWSVWRDRRGTGARKRAI